MKRDFYTTPGSALGMTARELVLHRLHKLAELMEDGKNIKDTAMTRAFIAAVS